MNLKLSYKTKRTFSYISALIISSLSGTQYLFSAYSIAIAERLGFTSVQINTIGSSGNYGLFLSAPFFGYLVDNYPSRITPMLAAVGLFTGYFCLAITYQGYFESKSFLLCVFYLTIAGISSSAAFFSALGTISANVKSFRGIALGAPMALFGLTAFMYSQINSFFFKEDTYHFLLFIALSTGTFIFTASIFLVKLPPEEEHEEISSSNEENSSSPLTTTSALNNEERIPLISRHEEHEAADIGGWELFQNIDAMLIGSLMFLIGGVVLMYINNVGAIIKSLYLSTSTDPLSIDGKSLSSSVPHENEKIQNFQNLHVAILSICSCFGRFGAGFVSDLAKNTFNMRRTWLILVAGICVFVGQILTGFIIKDLNHLWISTIFIGIGYGFLFGISPTIVNEWFGTRYFGLNW
ncbi:major facilitator superfamily domain-containing protein [Glomus cerebriforme]|uniref:Major facilitator superfamily domain-containing protein n=1 Tax=Glomus cerebriforme TaxID=658196 RepID=A0A397ST47_9GLOM|nr:major facilitator superfamily domain-containing protein [Glomus cerebriforme]